MGKNNLLIPIKSIGIIVFIFTFAAISDYLVLKKCLFSRPLKSQ